MEEIENTQNNTEIENNILPEIPNRYIRLTHFTTEDIAKKLISSSDFKYKELSSTTDSFSDNKDVLKLLKTGKSGAFSRPEERFGNAMIIMDLDIEEHKLRCSLSYCKDKSIPNSNILGYILRGSTELNKNSNYNPQKNELTPINPNITNSTQDKIDIPVSSTEEIPNDDIW